MREERTPGGLVQGVIKPLQLARKSQDRQTAEDLLVHPKIGAADNGCGDNILRRRCDSVCHFARRAVTAPWPVKGI